MIVTTLFTFNGIPKTGLSPVINIWDVNNDIKVITDASMVEIGSSGIYKYDFNTFDGSKLYFMLADGGAILPDSERYKDNGSIEANVLTSIPSKEAISDQVWDEIIAEHSIDGSAGKKLDVVSAGGIDYDDLAYRFWNEPFDLHNQAGSVGAALHRLLGLVHENHFIDQTQFENGLLVSARIRLYNDAAKVGSDAGVIAAYLLSATYLADGVLNTYKVIRL